MNNFVDLSDLVITEEPSATTSLPERLNISDGPAAPALYLMAPLLFIGVGALCFLKANVDSEGGLMWGFVGVALMLVALLGAGHQHEYLDFSTREVVQVHSFATFHASTQRTPLEIYGKIVVRHLCHPGGEGEDTFSGSVGLKSRHGKSVYWVKHFPATKDEMSGESDAFASALSARTGIPYNNGSPRQRQQTPQ